VVPNCQDDAAPYGHDLAIVLPPRTERLRTAPDRVARGVAFMLVAPELAVRLHAINDALPCGEDILKRSPAGANDFGARPSFIAATIRVSALAIPPESAIILDGIDDAFATRKDLGKAPTVADLNGASPIAGTVVETVVPVPDQIVFIGQRKESVAA